MNKSILVAVGKDSKSIAEMMDLCVPYNTNFEIHYNTGLLPRVNKFFHAYVLSLDSIMIEEVYNIRGSNPDGRIYLFENQVEPARSLKSNRIIDDYFSEFGLNESQRVINDALKVTIRKNILEALRQ